MSTRDRAPLPLVFGGGALVGGYLLMLLVWPSTYGTPVEWVAYLVPFAIAVIAGTVAAWRSTDLERDFWGLLTAALFLVFLNDLVWSLSTMTVEQAAPAESPIWIILAVVGVIVFLVFLFRAARAKRAELPARMRYVTDLVIIVAASAVPVQVYVVGPLLSADGFPDAVTQLSVTFRIAIGVAILLGMSWLVVGLHGQAWRSWERLVVAGLAVYAAGLLLWPVFFLANYGDHPEYRPLVVTLWMAGVTMVAMGAIIRARSRDPWIALRQLPPFALVGRTLPLLLHALGIVEVALIAVWCLNTGRTMEASFAFVSAVAIGLLLVFRDMWVSVEGARVFERYAVDELTGLASAPVAEEELANAIGDATRYGAPLSVIIFDIDDLATLNETGGYGAGDRAIRACADVLREDARASDLGVRLGGDEILLLKRGTPHAEAMMCAEGMRERISHGTRVTASFGVATFPQDGLLGSELRANARTALEWCKRHGKDRVAAYGPEKGSHKLDPVTGSTAAPRHLSAIKVLAVAVDARVPCTSNHSRSVADLVWYVAQSTDFGQERADIMRRIALIHDVGKIGVPDHVLHKRGPLTAEERAMIEQHPLLGEQIVAAAGLVTPARWVRAHHERWDGSGYPDGLRAAEIPVESRLLAVCDAFDAMTSERPYRAAMSIPAALQEIDMNMGTQFDPEIADLFIRLTAQRLALNPTGQSLF